MRDRPAIFTHFEEKEPATNFNLYYFERTISQKYASRNMRESIWTWQDQNLTNFVKNVNILEFGYYISNPYEKCIQKSPNMPGIVSLIREIDVNISVIWETNILFLLRKTNTRILSVKISLQISKIFEISYMLYHEELLFSCLNNVDIYEKKTFVSFTISQI